MQFETIKTEEFSQRVKLVGVTLKPRVINKTIVGVEVTDSAGNTVVFEKRGYSDFEIMVPTKPKRKAWKVTGTLKALGSFEKVYDKESQAIEAKAELKSAGADDADWNPCEVEIDEVASAN